MKLSPSRQLSIRVPAELKRKLSQQASDRGQQLGDFIRMTMEECLNARAKTAARALAEGRHA